MPFLVLPNTLNHLLKSWQNKDFFDVSWLLRQILFVSFFQSYDQISFEFLHAAFNFTISCFNTCNHGTPRHAFLSRHLKYVLDYAY